MPNLKNGKYLVHEEVKILKTKEGVLKEGLISYERYDFELLQYYFFSDIMKLNRQDSAFIKGGGRKNVCNAWQNF